MSFDRLKATGLGRLRMRIAIEGWPEEFVSSETMARTASGTTRARLVALPGPREEVFEQQSNPIDVIPEPEATKFQLIDYAEQVTRSLYLEPTVETWLREDVEILTGGVFLLKSVAGISIGTILHVNREAWEVTAVDAVLDTVTATREIWDTRARYHYTQDSEELSWIEVTDRPRILTGRYVYVYLYGEGDNPVGNGTLFWRGRVSREPKGKGGSYSLHVDPLSRVLDGVLGQGLGDPLSLRGVHYHIGNPLECEIRIHSTTSAGSPVSETWNANMGGSTSAIFETQSDWAAQFQTDIDTAISTATGAPLVHVMHDDSNWWLEVEISTTTVRYVTVHATSAVDGTTISTHLYDVDNNEIATVASGERLRVVWANGTGPAGARGYPRGGVGQVRLLPPPPGGYPVAPQGSREIYPAGAASIAGTVMVLLKWPSGPEWPEFEKIMFVESVDVSARSIELRWPIQNPDGTEIPGLAYTAATMPEVTITRLIHYGGLDGAISSLVTDSATHLNLGEAPMLRSEDTDLAVWTQIVGSVARGRPVVNARIFAISGEIVVKEWLLEEMRLLGIWLGFDATGRFVPREAKTFALTDPEALTVAPLDDPEPSYQRQGAGTIKGAIVKTGYVPLVDEWQGNTHVILDVQAHSRNPLSGMLEIAPMSAYDTSAIVGAETADEIRELTRPVRAAYGYPYDIETFSIPMIYIDVALVGAGVRYTPRGREFPNALTGTRDPVLRAGQVIGRTVDFGTGTITISVQKMVATIYGYGPSYYISSEANVSGNQWDLTLTDDDPWANESWADAGEEAEDFIGANDQITIYEWNESAPVTLGGTVDSVTGNVARVTFSGAWVPGSSNWVTRFKSLGSSETDNMAAYAWYADDSFIVGFTGGDEPARRYAP